jgi:OOP family OmpA-OmpF porin
MASKTYGLILGLISLFSSAAFGQGDAGYDWRDSSKISTKNLPQHTEFLNNNYPYPAKPRSMWELGFSAGNSMILGDIKSKADLGGSISLRKALSHVFSVRGGYYGSYNQGYPNGFQSLPQGGSRVPFQNWTHRAGLDLIASLNSNSRYRGNPKTNIYVLAGADLIATRVFFRAPNGQQIDRSYAVFYGNGIANTQAGTITTFGGAAPFPNGRKGWTLLAGASGGAGVAFKLNRKVNIGLEQRFTYTPYDYLDAARGGKSNDIYSYTSARLNLNIGSSASKVEPLWWINGNNFVYNELNRPQHMKIPPPVLPDADGDGVTDQFDMEPNTPAGAPVDVRGVAKDTDADGVPDYKDKELLTSQKCFPVDADGVGTCPEAPCCKEIKDKLESGEWGGTGGGGNCGLNNLPSIQFRPGKATLTSDAVALLARVAGQVKGAPACRIRVVGHGASDKSAQQLSWDRVNSVIRYLVERQGIAQDRFIFSYGEEGDPNSVDLIATKETGPNTVPAPHPNLKSGTRRR